MGLTIEDLKPKDFKITVKGVELDCKPLKLHQTLMLGSISDTFSNLSKSSEQDIAKANKEVMAIINEAIPELDGIELDGATILSIMTEIAEHTQPSDDKYLKDNKVTGTQNPKAEGAG